MSSAPTPARFVVSLDDARKENVDVIGLKGWYLSRLRALGYDTPNGFVVVTAAYEAATRKAHVDHRLHAIWAAARNASGDDIAMLARKARHRIAQIEFDGTFTRAIGTALASQ